MFNLGSTLDTVIAMVVVILVLSLLVQAIQGFIKKIFKLKSKEIEKSLVELFKNIIDKPAAAPAAPAAPNEGTPPKPRTDGDAANKAEADDSEARELYERVLQGFKNIGRYTKWGRPILESISKEDLLKILAREDSKHFYADYATKFKDIYGEVMALEKAIGELTEKLLLRGAASAKFAEMQAVLAPLINDIKSIVSGNDIKAKVFLGDLISLRNIKLDDALGLLSQAQESVARDLQAERQANNTAAVTALETLSTALTEIAGIISQLGQKADLAFTTLRAKLDHVELWYDTVMQSFEERYIRHMKNVSIYISIGVVIFLNASLFSIYRSIATNDQQRDLIVKAGEQWLEEKKGKGEVANANITNNTASNRNGNGNSSASLNSNSNGAGDSNRQGNASPTPAPTPTPPTLDDLKKDVELIKQYASTYEDFGFSPLSFQRVSIWAYSFFKSTPLRDKDGNLVTPKRDKDGNLLGEDGAIVSDHKFAKFEVIPKDCKPTPEEPYKCDLDYRDMTGAEWWTERKNDFKNLLGWFFMVLLLSVGAPFWQDTLESLFGIKNLLRKKSGTKNVEEASGQGQPRT